MLQILTKNVTTIKSKMLQFLDAKWNNIFNGKFINEKYVNLFTKKKAFCDFLLFIGSYSRVNKIF